MTLDMLIIVWNEESCETLHNDDSLLFKVIKLTTLESHYTWQEKGKNITELSLLPSINVGKSKSTDYKLGYESNCMSLILIL